MPWTSSRRRRPAALLRHGTDGTAPRLADDAAAASSIGDSLLGPRPSLTRRLEKNAKRVVRGSEQRFG